MIVDISQAFFDKSYGKVIELVKIVGSKKFSVFPVKTKPVDIFLYRINKFKLFFCRVGIIEPEVAFPSEFLCCTKIKTNCLGMTDMKIAIWLRRESGMNPAIVFPLLQVFFNKLFNKIQGIAFLVFALLASILLSLIPA